MVPNPTIPATKMSDETTDAELMAFEENWPDPTESPLGDEPSPESTPEFSLTTFLAAFQTRGRYHLADLNLDEEYLETFLSNLALRIDGILQKYRAGQLEHGGDIRDRDLSRERSMEIDDLVVYDVVDNTCKGLKVTVRV